jgi:multicomponent Na+:H+ antiporter subunit F
MNATECDRPTINLSPTALPVMSRLLNPEHQQKTWYLIANSNQNLTALENIWQKMLAFASVATKASIILLVVSVLRDDWMLGVVGAIVLSVGNAGLMLLAQILKRMNQLNILVAVKVALGSWAAVLVFISLSRIVVKNLQPFFDDWLLRLSQPRNVEYTIW